MPHRKKLLLIGATTGYQTGEFSVIAGRLNMDLLLATDRCHVLDDPWGDRAIALRFEDPTRAAATLAAGVAVFSEWNRGDEPLASGDRKEHEEEPWPASARFSPRG